MKFKLDDIVNYKAEQFLESIGVPFPTRAQLELTEQTFSNFISSEGLRGALSTNSVANRIFMKYQWLQRQTRWPIRSLQ